MFSTPIVGRVKVGMSSPVALAECECAVQNGHDPVGQAGF